MTDSGDPRRENEALRERISTLDAAILRISATLDLDTVLGEAVESARKLTGARYGAVVTVDETGADKGYVLSGFTLEQEQQLVTWPDNVRLFQRLRELPGPLRVADLSGYRARSALRPRGCSRRPCWACRCTTGARTSATSSSRGRRVLRAFTDADEEVLVLFASQAAAAIVNALTHSNEQQARADLAALVETSPVGVVVFDAKSARLVSLNREARRIVESLRTARPSDRAAPGGDHLPPRRRAGGVAR